MSWECLNCGMPTFSTAPFNSTYSIESDNHFSHLSKNSILSSPGVPAAASSPKLPESSRHNRKLTKDISNKVKRPIRVLNINFQSVCNKKSVKWNPKRPSTSICCDNCETWFHIECQIRFNTYSKYCNFNTKMSFPHLK